MNVNSNVFQNKFQVIVIGSSKRIGMNVKVPNAMTVPTPQNDTIKVLDLRWASAAAVFEFRHAALIPLILQGVCQTGMLFASGAEGIVP